MAMRTKKGTVTASARKKSGMKGGSKSGKFPVFDHKSAMSALKLRHNGKGVTASSVIAKVRRWARAHGDKAALAAADRAAEVDRKRKSK
jgi:hypothetical protein